jgi:hypothetical protein
MVVIIILLLLTNIGMLAFFLWPKLGSDANREGAKSGGMVETLKNDVGFDSVQVKEIVRLRESHWKKMKPLFEDLQNTKNDFYLLLKSPETPDSVVFKAASLIGEKQRVVDLQMFQHFKNSRLVCRPDQRPKYDSVVQIIIKRMSGSSRGSNNRRHEDDKKK